MNNHCKLIPFIEFLSFIGKNSLGFYFLSGALPIAMSIGIHRLFAVKGLSLNIFQNALSVVMLCVASLLIAYLFVHFANNYTPWLWDMRKVRKKNEKLLLLIIILCFSKE